LTGVARAAKKLDETAVLVRASETLDLGKLGEPRIGVFETLGISMVA
jgi:hypothetical protein